MQMVMPLSSACAFTLFRNATQFSAPSASGIPLRVPLNVMMLGTPLALAHGPSEEHEEARADKLLDRRRRGRTDPVEIRQHTGAEVEAAVGRGVQRLTSRRLGERRADAVPGVGGDVLQIVAELQRDAPGESKLGRAWRERARGEPGVRKHRCPALLEDDFEEVARAGPSRAIELEAPLLRSEERRIGK